MIDSCLCIYANLDPFIVSFEKTAYSVNEFEEYVEVCVILAKPEDILDNEVGVEVFNSESSQYIPYGSPIACK